MIDIIFSKFTIESTKTKKFFVASQDTSNTKNIANKEFENFEIEFNLKLFDRVILNKQLATTKLFLFIN